MRKRPLRPPYMIERISQRLGVCTLRPGALKMASVDSGRAERFSVDLCAELWLLLDN